MTEESKGLDPYEAVLSDLRAKRVQIEQAIQALETLRGGVSIPAGIATSIVPENNPTEGPGHSSA